MIVNFNFCERVSMTVFQFSLLLQLLFASLTTSAMAGEANLNLKLLSLQDVPINNHASFICAVTGSLTVVKWKKDDVTIDLTDFHYQFTSDLSELDIDSVDATDAGSYQCIAQDADKKIYESNSKSLRVLAKPTIHPSNATTFACKGSTVTLSCFGKDFTHVLWWFSEVKIQNQAGYQISGNANERLAISQVALLNAGQYTCKAVNQYSSLASSATQVLEVEHPPVILEGPRNGSFLEQYDIYLFCNVSAVPLARIYWKKDRILVEELGKRYQVDYEEGTLIIENGVKSDAGKYACFANYSCTSTFVESNEAEIKVVDGEAVPFYSQDVYRTIPVGANAEIQCKANQSLQSETVVWSRNGKWLTSTKHLTLSTNGQMIIRQATYNISNTYECNVRSRLFAPMATLFQKVVVTVRGPPDAPRLSLQGVKLENGRAIAEFNWTSPFNGNSRIIDYWLYYRSGNGVQWSSRAVDGLRHSAIIALPNVATTDFFVRARNNRNFSEKSNVIRVEVDVSDLTSLFFSLNTILPGTVSATESGVFRTSTTASMPAASLNNTYRVIIAICACLTIMAAVLVAVVCGTRRKRVQHRLIQRKLPVEVHTSQSECSNSPSNNSKSVPKAKSDDQDFSTVQSYSSSSCS